MKRWLYIVVLFVLAGCTYNPAELNTPLTIQELTTMPEPKACAVACALNDDFYIFGGRDTQYSSDLWCFHGLDSSWTKIETPLQPRVNAALVTDGQHLFIGLGFNGGEIYNNDSYPNDWWCYEPTNSVWTQLSSYPSHATNRPIAGYYHDTIYLAFGSDGNISDTIYAYDIASDSWSRVAHHRAPEARMAVAGTFKDARFYTGLGFRTSCYSEWYSASVTDWIFSEHSAVPSKGRILSACTATSEYIYIFGGRYFHGEYTGGEVFKDFFRFDTQALTWTRCGNMPCGAAENQIAFTYRSKACFGLGEHDNGQLISTIYCIEE